MTRATRHTHSLLTRNISLHQIPTLAPYIPDLQHLLFQTINLTVKRGQKAVGQCELALSDLQPDTRANLPPAVVMNKAQAADAERVGPVCDSVRSAKFRAMVLLHGRRAGYVQGRVYVYAIDRLRTAVRCYVSPVLYTFPYM